MPRAGAEPPTVPLATFQAQVTAAQRLVSACAGTAPACDPASLPAEERVAATAGHPAFRADWDWLRTALDAATHASASNRAASMHAAQDHLAELLAETGPLAPPSGSAVFAHIHAAAANVLARPEFQADAGPSWWDRQIARLQDAILSLFVGLDRVGARNPWLAPLIEWSCFLLAAGGLLFFIRRTLARQSLRLALGEGAAAARRSDLDTIQWARLAEEHARAREWREAIHCLYWAAIVSLESRRAWRPNPTRTPREYPRLLPPGSEAQRALRALTRGFEVAWYGHGASSEADFRAAEQSLAAIRAADLKPPASTRVPQLSTAPPGAI